MKFVISAAELNSAVIDHLSKQYVILNPKKDFYVKDITAMYEGEMTIGIVVEVKKYDE